MDNVTIAILNYNGKDYLEKFLSLAIEKSVPAQIVVADNDSNDGSVSYLKSAFPTIRCIELGQNHGYAGGYNEALKEVQSDYYVLLNSDVAVTEDWLTPLVAFMESHPDYAACQPKIKDYQNKEKFEYAGACGGCIDALGYPYCRGRILNHTEIDEGQYDEEMDVFWASGACMMVRAKDFHEAGGFDASFFAHMEEIDLCWRFQSHQKKIRVLPQSVVFHVGGGTLAYQSPFKNYLNFRNGLSLLIKNLPISQLLYKLPIRVLLDWIAAVAFLLSGQPRLFVSVIKAHLHVISKIRITCAKRNHTSPLLSSISIVWRYYVGRKKRFSD